MIEKKITEILEPLVDEIVDVRKKIAEIELKAGPQGERGADGKDGADGERGADGSDGVGIAAIKQFEGENRALIELTDGQSIEVELPRGEKGDAGDRGVDGRDGVDGLGLNTKAWEPGVYREGVHVTTAIGKVYKALTDTAAEPGKSEDWERVGSFGFEWKGLKKADATYENGDLYIDGGSAFIWWNGKGRMFVQRGAKGDQGERGADGKDGQTIVAIKADANGFHLAMSDGEVLTADVEGLDDYIDAVAHAKTLNFLEAQAQQIEDEGGTPFRSFMGQYIYGRSYSTGDVVRFNKSLWIAKQKTRGDFIEDEWRRVYSGGGGGGGGGGGVTRTTQILADGPLSLGGFGITNVQNPRNGAPGALDAVNQQTVDQKIAAKSLYQGLYHPYNNTPDLAALTDSGFVAPVRGDTIARPDPAAPAMTTPGNILTWHNWKNNGFDAFAAAVATAIPISVMLSNGKIVTANIPPGNYADENALATVLGTSFAAATEISAFHVYVNGSDCHIGVETVAPVYAVAISNETGNAFPAAVVGAANTVLNTYNWVVSTNDPNTPECAPPGIPGIAAGTTLRNSDIVQWNGTLNQFEIIRGGNLTQSFADTRYWLLQQGNMSWKNQDYQKGAVVYSIRHNAWFVATQNVLLGTAEPGGNMPLVQPPAEWKKINSSYGSHVFFGRGDYDNTNTTRANNWGMPANTFPPGQQPETGDSYYDLLTGSLTEFTIVKNQPIYTISGTTKVPPLDRSGFITNFADLARFATRPHPLPGHYYEYQNRSGVTQTVAGGILDGVVIQNGHRLYLIWSGDPDASNGGWALVDRDASQDPPPALAWSVTTPHPQSVPDTVQGNVLWGQTRIGKVTIPANTAKNAKVTLVYNIPADESFSTINVEDADGGGALYSFEVLTSAGSEPQISPTSVLARNSKIKEFYVKNLGTTDNVAVVVVMNQTLTANLNLDIVVSSRDYNLGQLVFNANTAAKVPSSLTNASFFDAQRNYPSLFRKVSRYVYDTATPNLERLLVSHIPNESALYNITLAGQSGTRGLIEFELVVNASATPQIVPKRTLMNAAGSPLFGSIKVQWVTTGFDVWLTTTAGALNGVFDLIVECDRPDIMNNAVVYDGTYSSTHTGSQAEFTQDDALGDYVGPFRLCTKAQYDAITHKNPNVLYLISV